ncbi:glycosyl hydrolase family 28-related protein [Sporolactobacillus pectinivorans]|uniref:glycosyl hydrolase family 28-related protein n=1 Tax=Sporolactobacillus pectinivorans TaxID=1591408 RepID=UPI000C25C793|nr:glycosyl hydrolase family 28-related protein [Sporolactobacillus pectinivorans]
MSRVLSKKKLILIAVTTITLLFAAWAVNVHRGFLFESKQADAKSSPKIILAKDFHVKGNGKTDDADNISRAINAAAAVHGTVYFNKGVYLVSYPIEIPQYVSIVGAGGTQTTFKTTNRKINDVFSLRGNQTLKNIGFISKIGIWPMGNNIKVDGCKFISSVQGIQMASTVRNFTVVNSLFTGSGYSILSNQHPSYDVTISHSKFLNNYSDDIEINAPSQRWTIDSCTFSGISSNTPSAGFGVGAALSAKNIVIKNSTFNNIAGQAVHAEDHSQVAITNSKFQNNGYIHYPGSPEADIAVLSRANVNVSHSFFYKSNKWYSGLAIYNTDWPVGGKLAVSSSNFYHKIVNWPAQLQKNKFYK